MKALHKKATGWKDLAGKTNQKPAEDLGIKSSETNISEITSLHNYRVKKIKENHEKFMRLAYGVKINFDTHVFVEHYVRKTGNYAPDAKVKATGLYSPNRISWQKIDENIYSHYKVCKKRRKNVFCLACLGEFDKDAYLAELEEKNNKYYRNPEDYIN